MNTFIGFLAALTISGGTPARVDLVGHFDNLAACEASVKEAADRAKAAAHRFHPVETRTDCRKHPAHD